MTTTAKKLMTVDEFLVWSETQDGRWELYNGVPYAMAPERSRHATVKFKVQRALDDAIRNSGLPCHMLPDGMTVRVSKTSAHEPDALVYCGPELPGDEVEVPNPVIVVEVSSPSTRKIDATLKLAGYFSLPSVHHYLIIDPAQPLVVHHQRQAGGTILTRIISGGDITLDPPGLTVKIADFYG
jgi:Uma2 family endonuclease